MDREESKKTSERMTAVRAREAREGKPRPSGQRGFGYSLDWMTIDEAEAALIREAADRVLRGESTYAIATDWNARGVPTVNGKQWSVNVLVTIMGSPRIAGLREHHGAVVAEGTWPAIIDRATHEQLRAVLAPSAAVVNLGLASTPSSESCAVDSAVGLFGLWSARTAP